jgi:hypothetical protein
MYNEVENRTVTTYVFVTLPRNTHETEAGTSARNLHARASSGFSASVEKQGAIARIVEIARGSRGSRKGSLLPSEARASASVVEPAGEFTILHPLVIIHRRQARENRALETKGLRFPKPPKNPVSGRASR